MLCIGIIQECSSSQSNFQSMDSINQSTILVLTCGIVGGGLAPQVFISRVWLLIEAFEGERAVLCRDNETTFQGGDSENGSGIEPNESQLIWCPGRKPSPDQDMPKKVMLTDWDGTQVLPVETSLKSAAIRKALSKKVQQREGGDGPLTNPNLKKIIHKS